MGERVAVIDGGGRGHVLAEAYSHSPGVDGILAFPGNDLMLDNNWEVPVETFPRVKTTEVDVIIDLCRQHGVTLIDVAQDGAVAAGLKDRADAAGIPAVGPTAQAGLLESDKAFAREFMSEFEIPHPAFVVCTSPEEGVAYLMNQEDKPWVIKAAGLAEGKGVIMAMNRHEAIAAISQMARFGKSGEMFLIEEMLIGEEFSTFAICDGKNYKIIGSAQDNKRVGIGVGDSREFAGDIGEMTGGMGANSPTLLVTPDILRQVQVNILDRTIRGMAERGTPYTGILYLGGMVSQQGDADVIEFNARWGDPEAQVIVPGLMENFLSISQAVASGDISRLTLQTDEKTRVVVTGAARGYPGDYSGAVGREIQGLDEVRRLENIRVYGAGIRRDGNRHYIRGGRSFYVVGEGKDAAEAADRAYDALERVRVDDNQLIFRTDIAHRDRARLGR